MAKSLNDLSRELRRRANAVGDETSKAVRTVAINVLTSLVTATPIDTGKARSNWQVGINSAPDGELPAFSPGSHGSTAGQNVAAALAAGTDVVQRFQATTDTSVQIVNNLPYISSLDAGASDQAPAGFVAKAVQAAALAARRAQI